MAPTNRLGYWTVLVHHIGDLWYLPHRRHRTAYALRAELERYGYRIIEQSAAGGDVVASLQ